MDDSPSILVNEQPAWLAAKIVSELPERRSNPAAGIDIKSGDLYVFGGQDVKVGLLKSLWRINLGSMINLNQSSPQFMGQDPLGSDKWEVVQTKGSPDPMSHAAGFCSALYNKFYIFGGTSHRFGTSAKQDAAQPNAIMHMLDLSSMEWESVDSGQQCRDDFAYLFDEAMEILYVFGGFLDGYKSNDLWSYSVRENKWSQLEVGSYCGPDYIQIQATSLSPITSPKSEFKQPMIPADDGVDRPAKRTGARMIFNSETRTLYLHGGMDSNNQSLNDMWMFSVDTKQWSSCYQRGQIPPPRSGHSLVRHENSIILFGGLLKVSKETEHLYQFSMTTNQWRSHTKHVETPQQQSRVNSRSGVTQSGTKQNTRTCESPVLRADPESHNPRSSSVIPIRKGSQTQLELSKTQTKFGREKTNGYFSSQNPNAQTASPGLRENQTSYNRSRRGSMGNTFYQERQSVGAHTTDTMRFRVWAQRPRAVSTLGPIPSVYSIPSLRQAKINKQKEFDQKAKTIANSKFSMLQSMAEDKKNREAEAASVKANLKTHGSEYAQKFVKPQKTPEPKVAAGSMMKGLGKKLLHMGEKKAHKVMRDKEMAEQSPTSLKMKTSFIMKNQNKSFDEYFQAMKRRNAAKGYSTGANGIATANQPGSHTQAQGSPTSPGGRKSLVMPRIPVKQPGQKANRQSSVTREGPKPRDGHVAVQLANNMFVFGGDRYQVPYNDLFFLPLEEL